MPDDLAEVLIGFLYQQLPRCYGIRRIKDSKGRTGILSIVSDDEPLAFVYEAMDGYLAVARSMLGSASEIYWKRAPITKIDLAAPNSLDQLEQAIRALLA